MAVRDVFKVSLKTYFNPSAWLGVKELKGYNRILYDTVKPIFTPDKPSHTESFRQSIKRQNLTEDDLKKTANNYWVNKMLFYILSLCSFFASFYYLFYHRTFAGWVLCVAVSCLFLSQGFRYSFWLFQIEKRKLGCTFKEWWQGKVTDMKD